VSEIKVICCHKCGSRGWYTHSQLVPIEFECGSLEEEHGRFNQSAVCQRFTELLEENRVLREKLRSRSYFPVDSLRGEAL